MIPYDQLPQEFKEALAVFDSRTVEEMYEKLHAIGVRGHSYDEEHNPIAHYLLSRTGDTQAEASAEMLYILGKMIVPPRIVSEFIVRFNRNPNDFPKLCYPELPSLHEGSSGHGYGHPREP